MAGRDPPSASKSGISLAQKIQSNQPPAQPQQVLAAINKAPFCRTRQRPGFAPAGDLLFLLVQAKKAKEHALTSCVPSLRYGQTCVTQFRLRCGKTRFALRAPLKQLPRSNAVLRQRCPQPEPRAAGASTRVGTDSLQELHRNGLQAQSLITVAAIKFDSELSRTRIWYCPLCPRLRRQALGAGSCTAECNCFVIKFAATV